MPLALYRNINDHSSLAIWRITEEPDELFEHLPESDLESLKSQHQKSKSEFAASRIMVKMLCEKLGQDYQGITKDEFDKPHLVGLNSHISISHSYPYAGAMIHHLQPCGMDIEQIREKVVAIGPKFVNELEKNWISDDLVKLITVWSAKETLYKIHGRKKLAFKKNMLIQPYEGNRELLNGQILTESSKKSYNLGIERIEDFIITFLES